jgi:putative redox protein
MRYDLAALYSPMELRDLERKGRLTLRREQGPRREVLVDKSLFDDFARIDPESLCARPAGPVLLVMGDGDDEERRQLVHAERALPRLPAGSRLDVLVGAPHGFGAQFDEVLARVTRWLDERL